MSTPLDIDRCVDVTCVVGLCLWKSTTNSFDFPALIRRCYLRPYREMHDLFIH